MIANVWVAEIDDAEALLDSAVLGVFASEEGARMACLAQHRRFGNDETVALRWDDDENTSVAIAFGRCAVAYQVTCMAVLP